MLNHVWRVELGFENNYLKSPVALVISGIMQPYKSGLDMLKEVKNIDEIKHIPWVISTNLGQDSIIKEAFELECKPILDRKI